ncbi:sensor histidine kinase [Diaphorobacter aerolatus]|uniref:histidine kinase n=1 Tax=Diaphorobacter aerolatus TaxID=1288495 RepID=A0A7H0GPQ7_9BURK|nr:sensor histidine kinase [Diaphorobacter aerolatus]QNP50273.1 sensor histidine kinase N-terminal domain-containing protein [Diaphorobacter aerolatus]
MTHEARSCTRFVRWRPRSLKAALLWWLVPALLLVMGGSLLWSTHFMRSQVDVAHDRAMAGALRAVNYNTSTESGGLSVEQPYLLLEFFELTVNGAVYFRVALDDGLAEIGNPDLPLPREPLRLNEPRFYNALYMDEPVRVAAVMREASPPIASNPDSRIIVQVAESLRMRSELESDMVQRAIERDALVVAMSVLLLVAGVVMTLKPLVRLRARLDARAPDDLSPVEVQGLPSEVKPLVRSINHVMERHAQMARAQRQFLDDASHQLRTPIAVLRTQVSYALRERDPEEMRSALHAMQESLTRAERLTQQMLALARAREAGQGAEMTPVELAALAQAVVASLWPLARARNIDLGVELCSRGDASKARVQGLEWLLREALSNLLDNAIRYTPRGGQVTLALRSEDSALSVLVEDSGGGMSDDDIARAGSRFRRGAAGRRQPGAGLGLAIVQTIAATHGATLSLRNRCVDGKVMGLQAGLRFTGTQDPLGNNP